MEVPRSRCNGLRVLCAVAFLILAGRAPLAASTVQDAAAQDSAAQDPAASDSLARDSVMAPPAAARVAGAERDFDLLDREAGLRVSGPFAFDYQYLVYYGNATKSDPGAPVDLWTAASVQADRIRAVFEDGWNYSLDMIVELFQADTLAYRAQARTKLTLARPLTRLEAAGYGFPIQALIQVPPGEYDYRIFIRDNNWEDDRSVNETRGRLVVPRPVRTQPFVSSIAIAADSAGTWRPAPDLALQLNAARIVQIGARPYVYFEVYGLTPGGDYRGEVRLVARADQAPGEEIGGAYQPFQMQYRGSVPADPDTPVRKVLRLILDRTEPGNYEVQVRVRDLATGESSEVRTARLRVQEHDREFVPVAVGTDDD